MKTVLAFFLGLFGVISPLATSTPITSTTTQSEIGIPLYEVGVSEKQKLVVDVPEDQGTDKQPAFECLEGYEHSKIKGCVAISNSNIKDSYNQSLLLLNTKIKSLQKDIDSLTASGTTCSPNSYKSAETVSYCNSYKLQLTNIQEYLQNLTMQSFSLSQTNLEVLDLQNQIISALEKQYGLKKTYYQQSAVINTNYTDSSRDKSKKSESLLKKVNLEIEDLNSQIFDLKTKISIIESE